MKKWLGRFLRDQSGTEIVEWAVIGAMVAGIAIGSFNGPISNAVSGLLGSLGTQLSAAAEPSKTNETTAATEPWTTHGATVSSEAKGDSSGQGVAAVANSNSAYRGNARR